ncbi:MAG: hypothetical protein M3040_01455, partial [Bacteroidota bacterium]|nr:hypothetical protein [Bacteroidota bacterium]
RIRLALSALAGLGVLAAFYFFIFSEKHSILPEKDDATVSEYSESFHPIKTPGKKVMIKRQPQISEYYGDNKPKNTVPNDGNKSELDAKMLKDRALSSSMGAKRKSAGLVYEVVTVAHFYDKPDRKARRGDSINYWNESYASIKPITQKNGFVYVVFKYPTGETAKGWLREKDLKKVNTEYGDNKD